MRNNNLTKYITTSVVLLALMAQTFKFNFVITDYYVNTANYIKNCINKSKPKSTCQGKCQMMKKMREEQQKEDKTSGNRSENKGEQVVLFNEKLLLYSFLILSDSNPYTRKTEGQLLDYHSTPLRPPIHT
jgi:hypothetical protein